MTNVRLDFLQAAGIAMSMHKDKSVQVSYMEDVDLEASLPALIQDNYHWLDLVLSIQHPVFDLPNMITYGRYRYVIDAMITRTGYAGLRALDPKLDVDPATRVLALQAVDEVHRHVLHKSLVVSIGQTVDEILSLPVIPNHGFLCSQEDIYIELACTPKKVSFVHRILRFKGVLRQDHRYDILRLKATESSTLSIRSMLLLTDRLIPRELIHECDTDEKLIYHARMVDIE